MPKKTKKTKRKTTKKAARKATPKAGSRIAKGLSTLAVPIKGLKLDNKNTRKHSERNIESIVRSLEKFGQRKPIVVQKKGMIVRAGNGTLQAARQLGWDEIAAVIIDEDSDTAKAFAIADNRTAELAEWEWEVLAAQLDEVSALADVELMLATGFTEDEIISLQSPEADEAAAALATSSEEIDPDDIEDYDPKQDARRIKIIDIPQKKATKVEDLITKTLRDAGYNFPVILF